MRARDIEMEISPSLLGFSGQQLTEKAELALKVGARRLHVDCMDGKFTFARNEAISELDMVASLARKFGASIDVHLLVADPGLFIAQISGQLIQRVSIQIETAANLSDLINCLRAKTISPGLALRIDSLQYPDLLTMCREVDFVHVASSLTAEGDVKIQPATFAAIRTLRRRMPPTLPLMLDGGIRLQHVRECRDVGVDVAVMGSALFESEDFQSSYSAAVAAAQCS